MRRWRESLVPSLLAVTLSLFVAPGAAQSSEAAEKSGFDRAWAIARIYEGNEKTAFQSFDLSGRLQLDFAYVDSGDDDHGEFNIRRFRFGFKTVFLSDFTLHIEGEFNPQEADPVYTRLTDTYLAWAPNKAFRLTVGKHSAGFTLDGMTSSKRLLTIDRSALTNNIWFTDEYIPGVSVRGGAGDWSSHAGVYSSGGETPEFGDFTGGHFVLLTVGRDFGAELGADEALVRLNFVDNEPDPDNSFTRDLERIYSLNFQYERAGWGVRADLSTADGYLGQSDLDAFYVMPYRRFSEAVELVARATQVESDDDNGVRFGRYERELADGRGDRYREIYLGLNYYWYGHKLKLQNGAQYVEMRDRADDGGAYTGWAWTTAFRLSW